MNTESKFKGSIKLSAIGDALGWMTEFERNTQSLFKKFGTERIDRFYTWEKKVGGRFYGFIDTIKAGSYSDDTQLLMAVARSIKKDGSVDHNYFAKKELANWLDYSRGGGRTIKVAADKIQRRSTNWYNNFFKFKVNGELNDYRESGANGAAMRVLPIALANIGNVEKIKEETFCNSITTHGHPRALIGAMLYAYAINLIIDYNEDNFNWKTFLTQIGLNFPQKMALSFSTRIEIREWLKQWNREGNRVFEAVYSETLFEAQNQLRFIFKSLEKNTSVQKTLNNLGCFEVSTKGSGISTVIAGIYLASKFHNKPLDALIEAVNALGSDTDSIAAFTGGLVGALHGHNIIPDNWNNVQDRDYLEKLAEKLIAVSESRYEETKFISSLDSKVLNNPQHDNFVLNEEIEFNPLGKGKITTIDRQPTLVKGNYNLLLEVRIDNGQSILVNKIFRQ